MPSLHIQLNERNIGMIAKVNFSTLTLFKSLLGAWYGLLATLQQVGPIQVAYSNIKYQAMWQGWLLLFFKFCKFRVIHSLFLSLRLFAFHPHKGLICYKNTPLIQCAPLNFSQIIVLLQAFNHSLSLYHLATYLVCSCGWSLFLGLSLVSTLLSLYMAIALHLFS